MAVTTSLYNHTAKLIANKEVDLTNLKVMLLDNDASFTASHTNISSISSDEVSGNGWDAGGELLGSVAVTTITTNDAKLDAADVVVTATGGPIGPAYKAVIYDDTNNTPLVFIDFGEAEEADQDTDFKLIWHSDGIVKFTVA